jgi:acyl-CoA synthetase (AMP-forming)/AMP-acid ligase II
VSVENALYSDDRILEAAVVGVPDERLGELVAAVVSIKPAFRGQVTEAELILRAQKRYLYKLISFYCFGVLIRYFSLPKFAVPVMVVIVDHVLGTHQPIFAE